MTTLKLLASFLILTTFSSIALADNSLLIGGIFNLSSAAGGDWGRAEQRGFELAIEEFKAESGQEVRSVIENSAYENAKAVSALQKLTSVDEVRVVIGPTWEVFAAVIPVCERKKVICIAPSFNNSAFDNPQLRYSFTLWFDERDYGAVHAEYLNAKDFKRIAIVTGTSPYYDGIRSGLLSRLNTKPLFIERTNPDERNFRSIINRMPKELDALMVFLLGDGAAQAFFRQWSELRPDRPVIFTDDALLYFDPPLGLKQLGFSVRYSAPELVSDKLDSFKSAYSVRFHEEPSAPSASVAYDATKIALTCMRNAPTDIETIRDCISKLKSYQGASGTISFGGARGAKERKMAVKEL